MNGFLRCVWGLGDGRGGYSVEKREEGKERGGGEGKKRKKKPTTLDDLQRLIAWLFLALHQASAHMGTLELAAPEPSFLRQWHLHCGSPAALITLPVQLMSEKPKQTPLLWLGDATRAGESYPNSPGLPIQQRKFLGGVGEGASVTLKECINMGNCT